MEADTGTDDLPFDPPPSCTRPLLWYLARYLLDAHVAGADGLCCLCRPAEVDPCPARQLAAVGLRTACGEVDDGAGAAWLDVVRRRLTQGDLLGEAAVDALRWLRQRQPGQQ